ncbi:MAG TPA: hypothetical protein VN735_01220 [Steroidobacteraceae bacterium]|nr:hypothetical protein [Steroidobacteraceae bacterium]
MNRPKRTITFRAREFKGSRLRCLLLTSQVAPDVSTFLTLLVAPHASVPIDGRWAPRGFLEPDEAKLGESPGFLPEADRDTLTRWWLARSSRANTPNWDIVSTCRIGDRAGLILVEAKAHQGEFADDRCGATNEDNYRQIEGALLQAETAWNTMIPGFALSAGSHYQLGNRFAFAWKLATMGTPVVLVYLGFLNAGEMERGNRVLLRDHARWRDFVLQTSKDTVPPEVWDRTFNVNGTALTVLIRSAVVEIDARSVSGGPKV